MGLESKTVTFVITEDCNFRCTYCYLPKKNSRNRLTWKVAKRAVDFLLSDRETFWEPRVVWDFIGGEPLLEAELIARIAKYAAKRAYELDHPWFTNYSVSITTNGSLYDSSSVQELIRVLGRRLDISITLDGTRRMHDASRLSISGQGTYDLVARNVSKWVTRSPNVSTKMTIVPATLPYVAESVLHLFELGIPKVSANCVFEKVWKDGDDDVFEEQLTVLAHEIVHRSLWPTHQCSLFDRSIGRPLDTNNNGNWCGCGRMLAIDSNGGFYPCNRFLEFSLSNKPPRSLGSVDSGFDHNLARPFIALTRQSQSTEECVNCLIASGCAWCTGANYDAALSDTIYQRSMSICRMHKARVRANCVFWSLIDGLSERKCFESTSHSL